MIRQATLPFFLALSPVYDPGAALERTLRKAARRGEPILLGSAAEPYEPGQSLSRSFLEDLARMEGLEISITARSPRILRDLELLAELDKRHSVVVRLVIEPGTPDLGARLQAVRSLAMEGIATCVLVASDDTTGEAILRPLLEEAREAGAHDVEPGPLPRRAAREPFLANFRRLRLEQGFPRTTAGRG